MDPLVHATCSFSVAILSASADAAPASGLSLGGLVFMCASIGGVLALVVFCYSRLLSRRPDELEAARGDEGEP